MGDGVFVQPYTAPNVPPESRKPLRQEDEARRRGRFPGTPFSGAGTGGLTNVNDRDRVGLEIPPSPSGAGCESMSVNSDVLSASVVTAHQHPSQCLVKHGSCYRQIRAGVLVASELLNTLQDANGVLRRPAPW